MTKVAPAAQSILDQATRLRPQRSKASDGTVDTVEHLTGLPIPDPEPPADDPLAAVKAADVARAIVRPLETLTGGSTSTATRNALLSVRAELDKLIEG